MTTEPLAIWALTPNGIELARRLARRLAPAHCFASAAQVDDSEGIQPFDRLKPAVAEHFRRYAGHIFIMAAGIVTRTIAPLLVHKTEDPAVVVMDERGKYAVSLISGHLGGANELARRAATAAGGQAVITTATDVNQLPSIDLVARGLSLEIENPEAIKAVNMALLTGGAIAVYDPYHQLKDQAWISAVRILSDDRPENELRSALNAADAGICIDDRHRQGLDKTVLVLRPKILSVGMGCNRNTPVEEMRRLLDTVLRECNLSHRSIVALASADLKANEPGLLDLAEQLNLEPIFFSRKQLGEVIDVPTPSAVVKKHIGVNSVCEAAAILAARPGNLIVPKHKTPNVTLAIARRDFTS